MPGLFFGVATRLDAVRIESLIPIQIVGLLPCNSWSETIHQRIGDGLPDSCYCNHVLAEETFTSPLNNDVSTFLFKFQSVEQNFDFILQKYENNPFTGVYEWQDLVSLKFNNFGTHFPITSFAGEPQYAGQQVDWRAVLLTYGEGTYRFACKYGFLWEGEDLPRGIYSPPLCLKRYSKYSADTTIRIEINTSGNIGSLERVPLEFKLHDYLWYDSVRLKGFFGWASTSYEENIIKYQNGMVDTVTDEQLERYQVVTGLIPYYLHERLKTYGLKSDKIYLSDFNRNNENPLLQKFSVKKAGSYEPTYYAKSLLCRVSFEVEDAWQSLHKNKC